MHRPKYDDWTLPKGKLEPGERHESAAVREVFEETGVRARLGAELPSTAYRDRYGRRKRVRYWEMAVDGGEFAPNHEVDEVRWVDPGTASRMLTYARDRRVIASLAAAR